MKNNEKVYGEHICPKCGKSINVTPQSLSLHEDFCFPKAATNYRKPLYKGQTRNGEWVYGEAIIDKGVLKIYSHIFVLEKKEGRYHEIIPETLGEYTSINDRYCRHIFEKDMINVYYEDKIYAKYANRVIIFLEGCFGFIAPNGKFMGLHQLDMDILEIELVGNLPEFENNLK